MAAVGVPALACRIPVPLELRDVQYADVVVVGRIANYRIVRDEAAREQRRKLLASSPDMPPELRKILAGQQGFLTDYARFDVIVDKVLSGKAPKTLSVTWDNSTFAEPEAMPPGPYVLALRHPGSRAPPPRGPSATFVPNREPGTLTVLQAPCAPAFIFETASGEAATLRKALTSGLSGF
jgi:hypothetical protein